MHFGTFNMEIYGVIALPLGGSLLNAPSKKPSQSHITIKIPKHSGGILRNACVACET